MGKQALAKYLRKAYIVFCMVYQRPDGEYIAQVDLPEGLAFDLERVSEATNTAQSAIIREGLRRQLQLMEEE